MKHSTDKQVLASLRGALLLVVAIFLWGNANTAGLVSAQATAGCPADKFCVFLPLVRSPETGDLVLQGIEVTQSVQNAQNSVHLVAGKATILRIYAATLAFDQAVPNVKISVRASNTNSAMLSGSPQLYTATVPLHSSRADYNSSINIALPVAWSSGTVDLTVALDADNAVREMSESNNSITTSLVFHAVPPLAIKVVPITFHNTLDGRTYPTPTRDSISDWIQRTYPISKIELSWHARYDFTGDLTKTADFTRLLNEITTIKMTEGAPDSQVYYGLVPTTDGVNTWFYGGYAGLGWVGSRVAIGLDYQGLTSQLAAHEIGHNLGMLHAPCGGATSIEPEYPNTDGSIGEFGLDVLTGTVYSPSSKDIMTYCSPRWISGFTYEKLFAAQVEQGANLSLSLTAPDPGAAAPQRGLLVRANIDAGSAELLPAYILPGQVKNAPEAGEYTIELLDEQGQAILQAPVRAYQAVEENIQVASIHALISLPAQPAAYLRLLKGEQVLAEQLLGVGSGHAAAVVYGEEGARLRFETVAAPQPSQPAPKLVRYSTDGGSTWTTLAVDVNGSEMSLPASAPQDALFEVIAAGY